jgi:hypothetical protein
MEKANDHFNKTVMQGFTFCSVGNDEEMLDLTAETILQAVRLIKIAISRLLTVFLCVERTKDATRPSNRRYNAEETDFRKSLWNIHGIGECTD